MYVCKWDSQVPLSGKETLLSLQETQETGWKHPPEGHGKLLQYYCLEYPSGQRSSGLTHKAEKSETQLVTYYAAHAYIMFVRL